MRKPPFSSQRLLHQGNRACIQGQWAQARRLYRQILKVEPRHTRALYGLALALTEERRYKEAEQHLETLLSLDDRMPSSYALLGRIFGETGQTQRAVLFYEKALELNPHFAHASFALAQLHNRIGDRERAKLRYAQCVSSHPQLAEAWMGLSELYQQEGELLRSMECHNQAVALYPALGTPIDDQLIEQEWQNIYQSLEDIQAIGSDEIAAMNEQQLNAYIAELQHHLQEEPSVS